MRSFYLAEKEALLDNLSSSNSNSNNNAEMVDRIHSTADVSRNSGWYFQKIIASIFLKTGRVVNAPKKWE